MYYGNVSTVKVRTVLVAMIERLLARRRARIANAAGEGANGETPTYVLMRRIDDAFAE